MGYAGQMTGADWRNVIVSQSQNIITSIGTGYLEFKKWYAFTYGMSTAQIASAIGVTVTEAADMQAAFNSLNDIYEALNNGAVAANDRLSIFLKFSF